MGRSTSDSTHNDARTCTDIVVILSALSNDAKTCTDKKKLSNILRLLIHILRLDSHSQTVDLHSQTVDSYSEI